MRKASPLVHVPGLSKTAIAAAESLPTDVDDDFVDELLGQPVQPLALDGCPGMQYIDFIHGVPHTLVERNQRLTQGGLPNVTENAGGNLVIGLVAPGGSQLGFAVAVLVQ